MSRRTWTEDERRMALTIRCPYCSATAGAPCRTNLGRWADYHLGRVLLAFGKAAYFGHQGTT